MSPYVSLIAVVVLAIAASVSNGTNGYAVNGRLVSPIDFSESTNQRGEENVKFASNSIDHLSRFSPKSADNDPAYDGTATSTPQPIVSTVTPMAVAASRLQPTGPTVTETRTGASIQQLSSTTTTPTIEVARARQPRAMAASGNTVTTTTPLGSTTAVFGASASITPAQGITSEQATAVFLDAIGEAGKTCDKIFDRLKCLFDGGLFSRHECGLAFFPRPFLDLNTKYFRDDFITMCHSLKVNESPYVPIYCETGKSISTEAAAIIEGCGLVELVWVSWFEKETELWKKKFRSYQPCLSDAATTTEPVSTTATARDPEKTTPPPPPVSPASKPATAPSHQPPKATPQYPQPPKTTTPTGIPTYGVVGIGLSALVAVGLLIAVGIGLWKKCRRPQPQATQRREPSMSVAFEAGNVVRDRASCVIPPRDPDHH